MRRRSLIAHEQPAFGAEHDPVKGIGEVGHLHALVVTAGGGQRRLVGQVGQVGAHHPRSAGGQPVKIDVLGERHRPGVDLENLASSELVGRGDVHAAVESPRSQERGIEDLGSVRGREHDDPGARVKPVHLGQDLVERLLALIVTAGGKAAPAVPADGVELVDEDDRRRGLLGLLEEIADSRGADPDDHLDELRRRHGEERNSGLPGHRARQQRLAGPWRS